MVDYTNEKALNDLIFMREQLILNHPGTINPEDLEFESSLQEKFSVAQRALAESVDSMQRVCVLRNFTRSFQDSHLGMVLDSKISPFKADSKQKINENFSLELKKSDLIWMRIPNFCPNDADRARLEFFITQLNEHRSKTIVFDLRGNGGGNSGFGDLIVGALCGNSYARFCKNSLNENVRCLWKVSESNLNHVIKFPDLMRRQFQENSEAVLWACEISEKMQKAYAEGSLFFENKEDDLEKSLIEPENLFKGKVFAIIDSGCFSACLDFLDLLKISKIPLVMLGEPTGADSCYMEVREVQLPSEIGIFRFPIRVFLNRMRGHNEPYKPDIDCKEALAEVSKLESLIDSLNKSEV